jgi:RNA polymerase sigma-70 factor (ECF subfamily)
LRQREARRIIARMATPSQRISERSDGARAPFADSDWVARIRESDQGAFEALVRHYSNRLCAFVYISTRDVETTKELVQDLFLWIWCHRHEWEVRGSLTTYLYRSARNRAVSFMRHDGLERRWQEEMTLRREHEFNRADPVGPGEDVSAAELSEAIDRALHSLPPRCRQVFTLNREHRLSYREIAETLGISVKTVEVHMGRGLAAMRHQLTDWV